MRMKTKNVCGVGINDAEYRVVQSNQDGKTTCPFYLTWTNMLNRCYGNTYKSKFPTYQDCTVCEEWLLFSNFKKWMEQQDWQGKQLDKDLLVKGNKAYSPETCVFVTGLINSFLTDCNASRGELPIGVHFDNHLGRFKSRCSNPFIKDKNGKPKREHLGYFDTPDDAHIAWKKRKHELAVKIASEQNDKRVISALLKRFV